MSTKNNRDRSSDWTLNRRNILLGRRLATAPTPTGRCSGR